MRKKITLGATITLMAVTATVVFSVAWVFAMQVFNKQVYGVSERAAMYEKLAEIDNIVRQNYIFDIDEKLLTDSISAGYVTGLGNPYSYYLTADEFRANSSELDGKMLGIGIRPAFDSSGFIKVREVYPGSPAQDVGLMAGDLIIQVGELSLTIDNQQEGIDALRNGDDGSTVTITYRRENTDSTVEVTRKIMDIISVYGKMVDDVGFIKILRFNSNTPEQFRTILNDLTAQGATGFVFDVRNNDGGTSDSVAAILDILLPEGPIATVYYKDGTNEVMAHSDENEVDAPMVVLTNAKTASAAELFTVALRDYDKAQVVGTTTFGKGTMQSIKKLNDGSAIRLTIAKYKPPKSEGYDGIGIIPDVEMALFAEEEKLLSEMVFDELNIYSDTQLQKAIERLNTSKREQGMPIAAEQPEVVAPEGVDPAVVDPNAVLPEGEVPPEGEEVPPVEGEQVPEEGGEETPTEGEETPAEGEEPTANGSAGDIKKTMSTDGVFEKIAQILDLQVQDSDTIYWMLNEDFSYISL